MKNFNRIAKDPKTLANYLASVSHMPCTDILDTYCEICPFKKRCDENDYPGSDVLWLFWLNQEWQSFYKEVYLPNVENKNNDDNN